MLLLLLYIIPAADDAVKGVTVVVAVVLLQLLLLLLYLLLSLVLLTTVRDHELPNSNRMHGHNSGEFYNISPLNIGALTSNKGPSLHERAWYTPFEHALDYHTFLLIGQWGGPAFL